MRRFLALTVVVSSVWACDSSKITLIGIAPVRVDIPVGKTAKVFVAVECLTTGNDWNADATITNGGTIKFDVRLVDEDTLSDDLMGTVTHTRLVRGPLGGGLRGFNRQTLAQGTLELSCPENRRLIEGTSSSGEGAPGPPGTGYTASCPDPADLAVEIDNGSSASQSYSKNGTNYYYQNRLARELTVPACCIEAAEDPPKVGSRAFSGSGQALAAIPVTSGNASPNLLCTGSPASMNCAMTGTFAYESGDRSHTCCTRVPEGGQRLAMAMGTSVSATANAGVIAQGVRTITIQGADPFVTVTGPLNADGSFIATGRGVVAGFQDIQVRFEGVATPAGVAGSYTLGVGGGLPGGQPITYAVVARRNAWDQYWSPIGRVFQRATESMATLNVSTLLGGIDFSPPALRMTAELFAAQSSVFSDVILFRAAPFTNLRTELESLATSVSSSTLGNAPDLATRLRESATAFGAAGQAMQDINDLSIGTGTEELVRRINAWLTSVAQAGTALDAAGLLLGGSTIANVSAASFTGPTLAANSIAVAFGNGLATATQPATATPLPTTLGGTTVKVRDSAGVERAAPLFFVSPRQINYLIPVGTRTGSATVTVTSSDNSVATGTIQIDTVAPSLFTANASGRGVAAAFALRVAPGATQTFEQVAQLSGNAFVGAPIDLGPESNQIFLLLFGTGLRGASSLAAVTATVGGASVPVLFVGDQGQFAGLDQINIGPLPRSLAGRGEVTINLTADGKNANAVTVTIR